MPRILEMATYAKLRKWPAARLLVVRVDHMPVGDEETAYPNTRAHRLPHDETSPCAQPRLQAVRLGETRRKAEYMTVVSISASTLHLVTRATLARTPQNYPLSHCSLSIAAARKRTPRSVG